MTLLATETATGRFRAYGPRHIGAIAAKYGLREDIVQALRVVSEVLPFRVNDYVLDELVDWSRIPDDPLFQLTFPQRGMLDPADEGRLRELVRAGAGRRELAAAVGAIRTGLNPHPSGQRELNVPSVAGEPLAGTQHKYRETVLYFPAPGQSCHAYCTYCFRWAQFVGDAELRFAASAPGPLLAYLREHAEVSDVLVTGGDPLVMSTRRLREHLTPLLGVESVRTIRIGSKALAYWPHRFVTDGDADDLLRLFAEIIASGRTLAVMAHFSHPRELSTGPVRRAIERIRDSGALLYAQAPLVARVNDDAGLWAEMWRAELAAGIVPYYLFVERDTGPTEYFKVPLARAAEIFHAAYRTLPGLARTVRGPVMSAAPGKVVVDGVTDTPGGRYFQLRMLQARNPALTGRPFRAHHSATASWLSELTLAEDTPPDLAAAIGPATANGGHGR